MWYFNVVFVVYGEMVEEVLSFDMNWFLFDFEIVIDNFFYLRGERWIDWVFNEIVCIMVNVRLFVIKVVVLFIVGK